jgi:phosphate transport system permease protein
VYTPLSQQFRNNVPGKIVTAETARIARISERKGRAGAIGDGIFHTLTFLFATLVLLILGGVVVALIAGAWPALHTFGLAFVVTEMWNPVTKEFGALGSIYGTLVTSAIAMLIGIPVAFGVAVFITEISPIWLKRPLATMIELLAAIPSIIYGIWGLFVFAPFVQQYIQPAIINTLGDIPGIGALFAGPPLGIGVLTAGIILAVMVLPFISSIMRDVFETVPPMLKESAYGLGATRGEVVRSVVLPYTRIGVVGGIMLGLGRALGETMAVTFVIGNAHRISASILQPGTTISAALANEFTEADSAIYRSSLIALGFILFIITFIVLAIAKVMLMRLQKQAGS